MSTKEQVKKLQQEIQAKQQEVFELLKSEPGQEIEDFEFQTENGESLKLSSLFGSGDELMMIQNMGKSCVYCTVWADTFNGFAGHIKNRVPFFVVSPDSPEVMKDFKDGRGWTFEMLSSSTNNFKEVTGFQNSEGGKLPGVSILKMVDGKIIHKTADSFGPGDPYCGLWPLMDLLEEGFKGWVPKYSY